MTICTSCGRDAEQDATEFPCPSCGVVLARCADCKMNANAYRCESCGFEGP